MKKNQMITFISLWFLTLFGVGLGFNFLFTFNDCNSKDQKINALIDMQDQWLHSYSYFSALGLQEESLKKITGILNIRGLSLKREIKDFKRDCKSGQYNRKLIVILQGYQFHLIAKQGIFQKKQDDLKWVGYHIRSLKQ